MSAYKGTIISSVSKVGRISFPLLAVFRFHFWLYFVSTFGRKEGEGGGLGEWLQGEGDPEGGTDL